MIRVFQLTHYLMHTTVLELVGLSDILLALANLTIVNSNTLLVSVVAVND